MPPKPRPVPKAALLGFTFAILIGCLFLLPDAIQGPVMIGLLLPFVVAFNDVLRHP